ncbi:MAG: roadblock/LC7 domain-containing protein [Planctomycetes bacterium]|nr:roadblock/LC7 domain-containing protein [Planctomycetota bacterium]
MIEVLDPLSKIAGVRLALLVAPDGVPVCVRGKHAQENQAGTGEDTDSLSALATGWLSDLSRSVAPLSWNPPQRVVLRAARGTLVMLAVPGAVLLAICDRGVSADELRLPMEGAVARMQRILRGMGERPTSPDPDATLPGGALPSRASHQEAGSESTDNWPAQSPAVTGQD